MRADPVECLDGGWHPDAHGQDREGHGRIRVHAAHEHVMAPDQEAQEADAQDGVHHRFVAEDRLAREGGEQLRSHAHAGQDGDVHLGMPEEPEQVLPEQRRAALMVGDDLVVDHQAGRQEEAGADRAVEQQQHARGKQHGETEQSEDGGDQPGPAGERHAHQGHALAAQVHRGGDEVDGAHQRRAAEDGDAEDPQVLAHAFAGTGERGRRR